jgi:hypothetical protein
MGTIQNIFSFRRAFSPIVIATNVLLLFSDLPTCNNFGIFFLYPVMPLFFLVLMFFFVDSSSWRPFSKDLPHTHKYCCFSRLGPEDYNITLLQKAEVPALVPLTLTWTDDAKLWSKENLLNRAKHMANVKNVKIGDRATVSQYQGSSGAKSSSLLEYLNHMDSDVANNLKGEERNMLFDQTLFCRHLPDLCARNGIPTPWLQALASKRNVLEVIHVCGNL